MQDLYTEHCKILFKEIFKNLNKWKDIPCPKTEDNKDGSRPQINLEIH